MTFMLNLIINNSILILFMQNPINIGILIMIQTINSCLIMNNLMNYPWFSYMTFMILIGALMIIFMYMCTLSWNSKMKFQINLFIMFMMTLIINLNFIMLIKLINLNKLNMLNMKIMQKILINNFKINMMKFFMKNSMIIILMMINLLLLILIIINKMNKKMKTPLRKMTN